MNRLLTAGIGLLYLSAAALGAADELGYSPDGGLVSFGEFDYVYDSASRLTEVWSNGAKVVENRYDAFGRRVIKRTPEATHTFVYDGWLLVVERVELGNGQLDQIDYWWGKDISGTLDGAGGIGGLLYLVKNGRDVYVPLYDGYGNVVQYVDKQGSIVAQYAYDAFGNTIQKGGVKADELKMRFSTKYSDDESGLYYFGRRFYSPRLARWLTRDPIEEDGGLNLYAFCGNNSVLNFDKDGCAYFAYRPLDSFLFKKFVLGNRQDEIDNTMVAHEQLFFEDGGIPTNLGFFDDNQVRMDATDIPYRKPHSVGWKDCVMRKAVRLVKPRKYKLLDVDFHNFGQQYNCQDWADDVRWAYHCIINKIPYYSQDTKYLRSKP